MTGDNFLNFNEEEDYSEQISKCEEAFENGEISRLTFSEEEFDFLIGYFIDSGNDTLVYDLTKIAYLQHPYSSEIIVRYADVLIVNRETEKAVEILNNQMGIDSCNSDIVFLLGRAYLKMGRHDLAKENIDRATSLNSEEAFDMLSTVAQDYIDINDFERALDLLHKAEALDPENVEIFNDMAFCLERSDKFKESLEYYEKYLDEDPFNENVWFNVGTIYARLGVFEKAIEAYDYALALDPENSSVMYNKAIVYVNTEKYSLAIETFKEFLRLEPDNLFALLGIADACIALDRLEDASIYFKQALDLDNSCIEANSGLAFINMIKQDHFSALVYLRRIMGSDKVDYQFLESQIKITYKRTLLAEFLVYHLIALYHLRQTDAFMTDLETLMTLDELWLNKLYELVPSIKKDMNISRKISKFKE